MTIAIAIQTTTNAANNGATGVAPAPADIIAATGTPRAEAQPATLAARFSEKTDVGGASLFSSLLGSNDAGNPATTSAEDVTDPGTDAETSADQATLLGAMTAGVYASPPILGPAPAQTLAPVAASAPVDATQTIPDVVRSDRVAIATLYPSATPFNLTAANIAVSPPVGAAPQGGFTALQDASQQSLAQQATRVADVAAASVSNAQAEVKPVAFNPMLAASAGSMPVAAMVVPAAPARGPVPAATLNSRGASDVKREESNAAAMTGAAVAFVPPVREAAAAQANGGALPRSTAGAAANHADSAAGTPVTGTGAAGRDDGLAAGKFATALTSANLPPAAVASTAPPVAGNVPVKLAGNPDQWQQPLREALGERLQVNLQRNNNQAVIRLDPPNMGSIEISIRQSAAGLQVNLSASNSEVVRQLNAIGDTVRQDLSTRQLAEVAVTVSASRPQAQSFAQGQQDGGRQQQQDQQEQRARTPGRALYQDGAVPTFAMNDQE